jgi:hypothetical protein
VPEIVEMQVAKAGLFHSPRPSLPEALNPGSLAVENKVAVDMLGNPFKTA